MSDIDNLHLPPFPQMTWGDCDWWDGKVDLSFGQDAALTVTPYDPSVSRTPADYQCEAMMFHLTHGQRVFSAVLKALLPYYNKMRPRYRTFLGDGFDTLMPVVLTKENLAPLIGLGHVHIHPWSKDGIGYIGLQFGCTWDKEHGLGLMMHLDRVVEIGGADVSFGWSPAEADTLT
jgi:hypothetical protein